MNETKIPVFFVVDGRMEYWPVVKVGDKWHVGDTSQNILSVARGHGYTSQPKHLHACPDVYRAGHPLLACPYCAEPEGAQTVA